MRYEEVTHQMRSLYIEMWRANMADSFVPAGLNKPPPLTPVPAQFNPHTLVWARLLIT